MFDSLQELTTDVRGEAVPTALSLRGSWVRIPHVGHKLYIIQACFTANYHVIFGEIKLRDMSKIVFVHRLVSFGQMAHTDKDVLHWFSQSFQAVGPYWKGKIVATGLSSIEQRILMPHLHSVEFTDKDFRKKTEEYFTNILTKIPAKGLRLEIGLEDDSINISESNMPLNIENYVAYKHLKNYPLIAPSKDEAERDPTKKFYIFDPAVSTKTNVDLNKLEDAAIKAYFDFKDDSMKVNQILTMLGYDIRKMNPENKTVTLKELAKRTTGKGDEEQKVELEKFINICNDKDLAVKYLIHELIGAQVLIKVGSNILDKETGKSIGENMQDAVLFLTNPKNSKDFNVYRAKYDNIVDKANSLTIEK